MPTCLPSVCSSSTSKTLSIWDSSSDGKSLLTMLTGVAESLRHPSRSCRGWCDKSFPPCLPPSPSPSNCTTFLNQLGALDLLGGDLNVQVGRKAGGSTKSPAARVEAVWAFLSRFSLKFVFPTGLRPHLNHCWVPRPQDLTPNLVDKRLYLGGTRCLTAARRSQGRGDGGWRIREEGKSWLGSGVYTAPEGPPK